MSLDLRYFRRYRMEIGLQCREAFAVTLPPGLTWVPWSADLNEVHAGVKYESFRHEIDAELFPCFADLDGCRRLMQTISARDTFLPGATWLIAERDAHSMRYCGTIQGIRDTKGGGAVQNLGVIPAYRGRGLGTALLLQALNGFQRAGLKYASLEVTAKNLDAIRLYERLGFRRVRSVYKTCEAPMRSSFQL